MNNNLIALDERVGEDVSQVSSFDDLMTTTGFDFETELVRPHSPEGEEIDQKWIIRRTDNNRVLGFVGDRYTPVGNEQMLQPFHRLVETYGARYENAGIIGGGKRCWISAVLPDTFKLKNRPDDQIQQRVMALFSHDGTRRNAFFSIAHRIFCNNQINVINKAANNSNYSVRHVKNWEDQLIDAQLGFENALALHKEFEYTANKLDSMPMTQDQMRGFTMEALPENKWLAKNRKNPEEARKTNRLNNRREQLVDLFINGAGNTGTTRWDALNAVTEYIDHHNQIKKLDHKKRGRVNAENRLVNGLLGGSGSRTKQLAVDLLLETKKFKSVKEFAVA